MRWLKKGEEGQFFETVKRVIDDFILPDLRQKFDALIRDSAKVIGEHETRIEELEKELTALRAQVYRLSGVDPK